MKNLTESQLQALEKSPEWLTILRCLKVLRSSESGENCNKNI